jgi:predicted nucleic acid-binding protein
MRIFLDTNIFLAVLNEEENWQAAEKVLLDVHSGKHTDYTSMICVSDILSGC